MEIPAALTAINSSITLIGKLREITKNMEQADLKTTIADLANELADAKLRIAELTTENAMLKNENAALLAKGDGGKPTIVYGCYKFDGEQGLYCPGCYDTKGKKYLATRLPGGRRQCTVCHVVLGSGQAGSLIFAAYQVTDRSQTKTPSGNWVKRDDDSGQFIEQKTSSKEPFKGVRKEK